MGDCSHLPLESTVGDTWKKLCSYDRGEALLVIKIKQTQMWQIYCYYQLQIIENN